MRSRTQKRRGTNGLPYYLVWIRHDASKEPQRFRAFVSRGLDKLPWGTLVGRAWYWVEGKDKRRRSESVVEAFKILGESAGSSLEELSAIANDSTNPWASLRALSAMEALGPIAHAALLGIASKPGPLRYHAIRTLKRQGTNALVAVPMLIEALDDPADFVQSSAFSVLLRLLSLGQAPDVVIPGLVKALQDTDPIVRDLLVRDLQYYYETNISLMIPYLRSALTNQDSMVRKDITRALEIIAETMLSAQEEGAGTD